MKEREERRFLSDAECFTSGPRRKEWRESFAESCEQGRVISLSSEP